MRARDDRSWGWRALGSLPALLAASAGCAGRDVTAAASDASVEVGPASALEPAAADFERADARLRQLRARFVANGADTARGHAVGSSPAARSVIGEGVVDRFDATDDGRLLPRIPELARRGVSRTARVHLPVGAAGEVEVEDVTTRVAIRFALERATDAHAEIARGIALYRGAIDGADLVHRVHAQGTEDFVAFETRPSHEELRYRVDVTRVAGLRLVSDTLEFLDASGTPRLRIAPPWVVDSRGVRAPATLAVEGCARDTSPRAPWGRAVTAPGAGECVVRVAWSGVAYPALVDPSWTTTGSMTIARHDLVATLLGSGSVLMTGGGDGLGNVYSTAELFDGASSFAATGAMSTARSEHTATLLASGKVLVAGGGDAHGAGFSAAELYDLAGTFTATGPMNSAHFEHTATLLGSGKVLIAGGNGQFAVAQSEAELFDGAGAFVSTGPLVTARRLHTATLLPNGKVLIVGGNTFYGAGGFLSSAELFDGTGTFTATGSMKSPREYHSATLLTAGRVLVAGGTAPPTNYSTAEIFDGVGAFATTGSLATARYGHSAAALSSGKVLIAGGYLDLSSAELFDGSGSFATLGAMSTGGFGRTATVLKSGNVLLAGGFNGSAISSAEIFALLATGACTSGSECASGVCEDGNCCAGPCAGTCMTCLAVTGACVAVKGADDADTCTGANTCSASGACLLKAGQPSVAAAACASGVANDGVCCSGACTGVCRTCSTTGGACVAVLKADDPDTCSGLSSCSASGACLAKNGQAASSGASCASGFAADGVCCDVACTGTCLACTAARKGSGADGTCGFVASGSDPRASCPGQTCSGTTQENGHTCDGAGACKVTTTTACAPYVCNVLGTACLASACTSDANCALSAYCASGACVSKRARGAACSAANQCLTGACVDGVCCDTACTGKCQACANAATGRPDGTCAPVGDGMDPRKDCPGGACAMGTLTNNVCNGSSACRANSVSCGAFGCNAAGTACASSCASDADCGAAAYCAPDGTCAPKVARGVACTANDRCTSGYCADGVCCDTKCDGQCQACAEPGSVGTCIAVKGTPRLPRTGCAGAGGTCGGQCDGVNLAACAYPSAGKVCGGGCADAKIAVCDSSGACLAPAACAGNLACDAVTGGCKSACVVDPDCAVGFVCTSGKCAPKGVSTCSADGTQSIPGGDAGPPQTCAPYRCASGACAVLCTTTDDCAVGYQCDTVAKQCVPVPAAAEPSGGCGLTGRGGNGGWASLLGLAAALGARLRRRAA
jgi:hypothetical protein